VYCYFKQEEALLAIKSKESSLDELVGKLAQQLLISPDQPSTVVDPSSDATAASRQTPKDDGPAKDGQKPSTAMFAEEPPKAVVEKPGTPPVADAKSGETLRTEQKTDESSNVKVAEQNSSIDDEKPEKSSTSDDQSTEPPSNVDQKPSRPTGQKPDGVSNANENFSSDPKSPSESTDRKPVESPNVQEESVEPSTSESKSD